MLKAFLIFVQIFFISITLLNAQAEIVAPHSIQSKAQILYEDNADSVKIEANLRLENMMAQALLQTSITDISLDTLKFLKSLIAENGKFRLLTWAFPISENQHLYSGFIQVFNKDGDGDTLINLSFKNSNDDLFATLPAEEWPGAVYYKLIEKKSSRGTTYTLLGWMGNGPGKAKRVVDVLEFDKDGVALFGKPIFIIDPAKTQGRMIFEFTDQVPFHLAYEEHPLPGKKKKKDGMIVFNRLTGNNPQMGRIFRASVPDYSTFDGLVFTDGKWQFHPDLDLRVNTDKLDTKSPIGDGLGGPKK